MIRCNYRFAGLEIAVEISPERMYLDPYRLTPFASEPAEDPHLFLFEAADRLDQPEGSCVFRQPGLQVYREGDREIRYHGPVEKTWESAYARVLHWGKEHRVQVSGASYPDRFGTKVVLDAISVEHLLARNGGVVFHCSYIDVNGYAVLFTAPSETGKSTQAELWNQFRGAQIVNGDRAAIRVHNGKILAEGIPFCGSSSYCENRSLPLKAIVYLAQAPVTSIRKLRGIEAFARVWEGVSVNTWDKTDMEQASETVKTVVESLPVFYMPCTPDETAVLALEQELNKLVSVC